MTPCGPAAHGRGPLTGQAQVRPSRPVPPGAGSMNDHEEVTMSDQSKLEKNASEEEPGQGETTDEASASRKDGGKGSDSGRSGQESSGGSGD